MLPRGLTLRFPSFAEVNSKIPPFRRGSSSGARLRLCVDARPSVAGQVSSSVVRGCKVSLSQGRSCFLLYVCLANNDNIKLLKQGGSNFHVLPELM